MYVGDGVIGLIEVIDSDFAKEFTDIEANEKTAAAEYDAQIMGKDSMKVMMEQDVKCKSKEEETKSWDEELKARTVAKKVIQEATLGDGGAEAIDRRSARSAQLKDDIATIQAKLADAQAEKDNIRPEEHAVFAEHEAEM